MQSIETFGKYQLTIYALITLPLILSAGFTLDYVFTAGEVKYRCLVPECEDPKTATIGGKSWLNNSLAPENCMRYPARVPAVTSDCSDPGFFDRNRTIPCDAWVYDPNEVTIHNEWGITCDVNRWKLTLVGTLNNLGQLFGLTFASTFSDKYGRRTVLSTITGLAGLSGLIHSFSVNYWMFITFEFIDSCFTAGIYSATFIYAMEMTGVKQRIWGSTLLACIYAVGNMWLGLIAMWVGNWRVIMRIIYGPGLLAIFLMFVLPESVRWLLANDKRDMAEKVYRKMASVNKLDITEEAFLELKSTNTKEAESKKSGNEEEEGDTMAKGDEPRIAQIRRSPKILLRLLICSFCWLTNTFVYYGLSLNSTEFAGNKYTNFILVSAIEIPSNIVVVPLLNRAGRKPTLCGSFILSGLFCLAIQFVPKHTYGIWPTIALVMYVCGKGCISISFSTSYVYTTELFPTTLRHSLLGICSMTGRIGSILAPQTPLLAKYIFEGLPLVLFGSMGLTAGLMSLSFPETLGMKLPDTIEEAERIGQRKPEKSASNGVVGSAA
ncbi:organic cation transporter protein-like [Copidosoma floridanum]|uniref:organic cation transporter protein-like n=1 Tax=Copidosoma floridanum TaxID=29053 RepID=UPI0006C948D1|nr:organic cation transporter protein-like [Copidosoma floridanum]XP_014213788.1 organic cation transporter protein-like [Copidosoma floridanum]